MWAARFMCATATSGRERSTCRSRFTRTAQPDLYLHTVQVRARFLGVRKLSRLTLTDIDFQCQGVASRILLAPDGNTNQVKDCWFTKPKTARSPSHGIGCQDLQIDRCHFVSDEQQVPANGAREPGLQRERQ